MTALAVKGLSKSFDGLRVTANVNLKVEPGERRLIIGPNGAGKTTLFNLITGELPPDSGSIQLFDRDITRVASRKRAHLGMARTYQIITLFTGDTILRNATLALPASAEALLMVISGGAGTLLGPIVGAALVVIIKNVVSAYVVRWNFMLGAIFVAIVVFMPEGLVPGMVRLSRTAWRAMSGAKKVVPVVEPKP